MSVKAKKKDIFTLNVPEMVSLSHQIANEMKNAIANGEIKPGTHIREAEVAGMLKISRSPVREAINMLLSEQILEKRPYRGVYVYTPTKQDQQEISEARILIENYAIEQFVKSPDSSVMDKIQGIIEKIKLAMEAESYDWKELMNLDLSLHEALCRSCGNRFLVSTWETLILKQRIIFLMDNANEKRIRISANEHMCIIDAIKSGDVQSAKELMIHHILSSVETHTTHLTHV